MFTEIFRAIMIFITSATILQNGLILIGTIVNYEEVRRTVPQRAIILSTTIADLVMGLVVMPFGLYFEFSNGWGLGGFLCDVWISADILCSTASIVSIAFHSMDKYYSLWTPSRYCGHVRHNWSKLYVAITWGLSGFVALSAGASGWARAEDWSQLATADSRPPSIEDDIIDLDNFELHMLMHEQLKAALEVPSEECTITNNPMFALYSAAVSFYVPASAIVYFSIHIRKLAFLTLEERRQKRKLAKERKRTGIRRKINRHQSQIMKAARHAQVSRSRRSQLHGREKQVAVLWELTILTFLVCWAPFFIAHPLSCFGVEIPEKILIVLPWLGYSHSIVNPILHAFLEPDYLRSFAKLIVRCIVGRRNSQSIPKTVSVASDLVDLGRV